MTYLKTYHNKLKSAERKPRVSTGVDSARYVRLNYLVVPIPDGKRSRCQRINCKLVVTSQCQNAVLDYAFYALPHTAHIRSHKNTVFSFMKKYFSLRSKYESLVIC